MNKMVSATEFKAKCLKLIGEMERDGVPITITRRGKPVAELGPPDVPVAEEEKKPLKSLFGMLKNDAYRYDDPFSPAYDGPWDAEKGEWEPEA